LVYWELLLDSLTSVREPQSNLLFDSPIEVSFQPEPSTEDTPSDFVYLSGKLFTRRPLIVDQKVHSFQPPPPFPVGGPADPDDRRQEFFRRFFEVHS